jgi:aldehyde:ferredoxin oxidoreductase
MNKKNKYFGVIGRLLIIDLTSQTISIESINQKHIRKFLGGAGYACRYLIDHIDKDTDPLSEENIMVIMTGPLCGTSAPSSGRFVVCAKSPYTNLWGESNCGGYFGPELKKAGFDGIVIQGGAENPCYITIKDDEIEIVQDRSIWGTDTEEIRKILKERLQEEQSKVLCIGQAGENLVKFANINANGRFAGRTGMGAVLGSKKLKGIVVRGTRSEPNIKNHKEFKTASKKMLKEVLNTESAEIMRSYGTSSGVMGAYSKGDLPIKYWSKGTWDNVMDISGDEYKENLLVKNYACYRCPIGCGRIINIENENYQAQEIGGPEYETIAGFGSMILNNNLESIAIANDLCNRYGLDTISTSSTIALLFRLYNEGKIDKTDVDGLELDWGNHKAMLELVKKTALREGIGDLIAEGSNAVGREFEVSQEEIATINTLEVPYHDMRSCYGMALTYVFSPRGACHTTADAYKALRKADEIDFTSIDVKKTEVHSDSKLLVQSTANLQDYRAVYSSLTTCVFFNPMPEHMKDLINALFGYNYKLKDIKLLGERIFTLKRLFNLKMGVTPKEETIPDILLRVKSKGAARGKTPNYEKLRKYYYKFREWDISTGEPKKNKLKALELENINY